MPQKILCQYFSCDGCVPAQSTCTKSVTGGGRQAAGPAKACACVRAGVIGWDRALLREEEGGNHKQMHLVYKKGREAV